MAPTPQITIRVDPERLASWKASVIMVDSTVSEVIRDLMDEWADRVQETVQEMHRN